MRILSLLEDHAQQAVHGVSLCHLLSSDYTDFSDYCCSVGLSSHMAYIFRIIWWSVMLFEAGWGFIVCTHTCVNNSIVTLSMTIGGSWWVMGRVLVCIVACPTFTPTSPKCSILLWRFHAVVYGWCTLVRRCTISLLLVLWIKYIANNININSDDNYNND